MTVLPIVARELRVASRRRATYWVRSGAALTVILLGVWLFLMMQSVPAQEVALTLFGILTGASVLYCLLSGVRATSDCLSEEKRGGTLGLLFLTDLRGYDVVLGKLAATSLNALYGVLAVVPMLAVPLLMGGVTLGEFGRMGLVTLNSLFFSLSIGMFVSALCQSARKAIGATFLLIFFFAGFLPAAGAIIAAYTKTRHYLPIFLTPSAGFTFYMGFHVPYSTGRSLFWLSMVVVHGLGWIFLALSAVIVPRTWQDQPAGNLKLRWRERWKSWSYGNSAERFAFRRCLLDRNPFYWLVARGRLKPVLVWAVLGLLACGWLWGYIKVGPDWLNVSIYFTTGLVLNVLVKGWFASEVGRQLAEDRHRGTLELLLSTPLTVRDILRGERLALQRQFLGPLLLVLAACFVMMIAAIRNTGVEEDHALWILVWIGGMLMLLADLAGLYWVGLWQALVSKNPRTAASASVARMLVLPWVIFALVALALSLSAIRTRHEPGEKFFFGLWFAIGLAVDIGFGTWARHKLLTEFRLAAAQRYLERAGFWKRLFVGNEGASRVQLQPAHTESL
jgi:ABC-type Na+ efflux pump permease subunit